MSTASLILKYKVSKCGCYNPPVKLNLLTHFKVTETIIYLTIENYCYPKYLAVETIVESTHLAIRQVIFLHISKEHCKEDLQELE